MIERTLVLVKPDGVERGLIGEILQRFEKRGLKIVALKMVKVDKDFAEQHYTEDITKRRGQHVRDALLNYVIEGPVVAMVIEGVHAVENVRKIVGDTEPKVALPGTIRGDFAHGSNSYADIKKADHTQFNPCLFRIRCATRNSIMVQKGRDIYLSRCT